MKLCIVFVVVMTALPAYSDKQNQGATVISGIAVFREDNASLPCNFGEQTSIKGTRVVYWQKKGVQSLEVVLEAHDDQEKTDHQDPKYVNRTELDSDGSSLILQRVGVQDEGTYECIVSQKPENHLDKIHHSTLQLKVIANFSHPAIAQVPQGKLKNGTTVNLTCSSVGGYPVPRGLDWIVSGRHEILKGEMQLTQDNCTKLYNLTSTLIWSFAEMVNISCRIHLMDDFGSLSSKIVTVEIEDEVISSSNGSNAIIAIVSAFVIIIIGIIGGLIAFERRRNRQMTPSTDAGNRQDVSNNGLPNSRGEDRGLMANDEDSAV
ncbi:T-lymphocyte activation antigen CD86-like [Pleurodeles waltl]|uniref:T-lymphocyte activation antigen CD86-like n=1 Tax=Pleurodeles waltl TaxID=8319 RepID=UPI003709B9D2